MLLLDQILSPLPDHLPSGLIPLLKKLLLFHLVPFEILGQIYISSYKCDLVVGCFRAFRVTWLRKLVLQVGVGATFGTDE